MLERRTEQQEPFSDYYKYEFFDTGFSSGKRITRHFLSREALLRWWDGRLNLLASEINAQGVLKGAYFNHRPIEAMRRHVDHARSIDFTLSIKVPPVGRSVFDR